MRGPRELPGGRNPPAGGGEHAAEPVPHRGLRARGAARGREKAHPDRARRRHPHAARARLQRHRPARGGRAGRGDLPLGERDRRRPDRARAQSEHFLCRALVEGLGRGLAARLFALQFADCDVQGLTILKGRLEDDRMLTGRGRYVSDWNLPGQAYGHFLRSDRAHAEILSIDASEALRHPGVLAVYTGNDLDLKSLPAALPAKGRGGSELINPGRPALAKGRVRFTGDAVALIVAESAAAAQDAAELVAIEYRDLPAVVSAAAALAPGAPLVHDAVPGNMVLDYESGAEAAAAEAFTKAARKVELEVEISRVVGNPMEPRACLAAFVSGQYHLYTCTQGAAIMRNQLSAVLGVPPEKIRVLAAEVGGGFGVRFNLYPEYCAALFAA